MQHSSALVVQDDKHIQNAERDGRDGGEIDRDDRLHVIAQKGHPALAPGRCLPWLVLLNRRLGNLHSQLEKFAPNSWRTPGWILIPHAPDQLRDFWIQFRSPCLRS